MQQIAAPGAAPVVAPPRSGEFLSIGALLGCESTLQAIVPLVDVLYTYWFPVHTAITVTKLHLEVTTLEANKKFRIGVYSDSNGRPGTLLAGSDELTTDSTGDKASAAISGGLVLAPGGYWIAMVGSWATAQIRSQGTTAGRKETMANETAAAGIQTGRSVAFPYAALPATHPGGTAQITTSIPRIEFEMA